MNKNAQRRRDDLVRDFERVEAWLTAYLVTQLQSNKLHNLRERRRAVARVQSALTALKRLTLPKVAQLVRAGYLSGREESGAPNASLNAVDREAIQLLIDNLNGRIDDGIQTIGRRADDAFRREGLRAAALGLSSTTPEPVSQDAFRRRLVKEGRTAFVDKAGRRWSLDTYTKMHLRTVTAEAQNQGARNLILARDFDVVEIGHPGRYEKDPKCDDHHLKKYSLTGRSDYPVMSEDDMPPFHPYCEHFVRLAPEAVAERRRSQKRRKVAA